MICNKVATVRKGKSDIRCILMVRVASTLERSEGEIKLVKGRFRVELKSAAANGNFEEKTSQKDF